jgi:hypothetical protein
LKDEAAAPAQMFELLGSVWLGILGTIAHALVALLVVDIKQAQPVGLPVRFC